MGNIAQKLLQKFLVMSQLGTLLTQGNGNLVQIVLQKAQFSFPIVTNVEYLADLLIAAELEQRIRIVEMLNKEELIASLEERLERQKKEETPYEEKQSA